MIIPKKLCSIIPHVPYSFFVIALLISPSRKVDVSCFLLSESDNQKFPRTFLCYQHLNSLRRWKGMPKSRPSRETCPTIGNSENHRLKSCQIWWFRNPAITTCDVENPGLNKILINQPINWYRISSINSISTSKFPGHQVFPLPNVKGSLPDLFPPLPFHCTPAAMVLAEPPQPSKAAGSLHCVHLLKCLRLGGKIINAVDGRADQLEPGKDGGFSIWDQFEMVFWLVVSTHLKNISQFGSFPQGSGWK